MKTVILYRPKSEEARNVNDFVYEFGRRYPDLQVELMDVDSRDGSATASIYDIVSYPAVLVLQNDGAASMVWQMDSLPLLDEVASYAR